MDQQYHAPDPRSGAIRQAELNPILGYKPDFMPSVVESTFPQVQDELKVADYHDLLEIPLETNKPDTEEMISRVEGNIRSTFVQNLQIVGAVFFFFFFFSLLFLFFPLFFSFFLSY